jgi:hypothetical protein
MSAATVKGTYLSMRDEGLYENFPSSTASLIMDATTRRRLYRAKACSTWVAVIKTIYLGDAIC